MTPQAALPPIVDVTLAPGQFHFGAGYTRIHTLLGSCVAITMWHPRRLIGGMCHYLLPTRQGNTRLPPGHFADGALELFLQEIKQQRTLAQDYEIKLFGGADMFAALGHKPGALNISGSNIQSGMRILQAQGLRIKCRDVGGNQHRRIFLELWNGDVWVQRGPAPGGNGSKLKALS